MGDRMNFASSPISPILYGLINDHASELFWYEGDDRHLAGWLCERCQIRMLECRYGIKSPEVRSLREKFFLEPESMYSLYEELERRANPDLMAG